VFYTASKHCLEKDTSLSEKMYSLRRRKGEGMSLRYTGEAFSNDKNFWEHQKKN